MYLPRTLSGGHPTTSCYRPCSTPNKTLSNAWDMPCCFCYCDYLVVVDVGLVKAQPSTRLLYIKLTVQSMHKMKIHVNTINCPILLVAIGCGGQETDLDETLKWMQTMSVRPFDQSRFLQQTPINHTNSTSL